MRTWADGYKRSSMTLLQQITPESDACSEVARARVTAVWVGPDRRPMRVPPEVRRALGGDEEDAPTQGAAPE